MDLPERVAYGFEFALNVIVSALFLNKVEQCSISLIDFVSFAQGAITDACLELLYRWYRLGYRGQSDQPYARHPGGFGVC